MEARIEAGSCVPGGRRTAATLLRDESGMVVLGPLIVLVAVVLVFGFLGYLKQPAPPRLSTEGRELRVARAPVAVEYGGVTIAQLPAGAPVWVYPLADGRLAVYRGAKAQRVVGFVPDSALARSPAP
jgi:hypothetical protein